MSTTIDQDLQAADIFNGLAAMRREELIRDLLRCITAHDLLAVSAMFAVPDDEETDDFRLDLSDALATLIARHDPREAATIIADTLIAHRERISAEVE